MVRTVHAPVADAAAETRPPAPRLQLRWEKITPENNPGFREMTSDWMCHYELVLPLGKYDIRAEVRNENGDITSHLHELAVPIKGPTGRGSDRVPCDAGDGTLYADTPFRDGAHAYWDAKVLGNLPVYVIAPNGSAILKTFEEA